MERRDIAKKSRSEEGETTTRKAWDRTAEGEKGVKEEKFEVGTVRSEWREMGAQGREKNEEGRREVK